MKHGNTFPISNFPMSSPRALPHSTVSREGSTSCASYAWNSLYLAGVEGGAGIDSFSLSSTRFFLLIFIVACYVGTRSPSNIPTSVHIYTWYIYRE